MAKKEFKAESKKLLDMMINSIYTHKEIFLREIISNASDAIDKLYYQMLFENTGIDRDDFFIRIEPDKDARTIKVIDNGIGMDEDELENNLGIIAKSGSFDFKNENEKKEDIDIIGQFGVGFYSAFMVSDRVMVETKKYGSDKAFRWESEGADGYSVEPCEKEDVGTVVTLFLKDDTEDENYGLFAENFMIQTLVKKYSDYISYPIKMDFPKREKKEGTEDEWETIIETRTLNSMVPIWKKNKADLKDEDYNMYYMEKFYDLNEPIASVHTKAEGQVSFDALLFIPSKAAFDYYSKDYEKGLALYTNGVMIMEKCGDLLPDYFNFVRGVVDSADINLNISRETLQHDRRLGLIAKNIEKKIKAELKKMCDSDRKKYEEFFAEFGPQLKFGVYTQYGAFKDKLQDLLIYKSTFGEDAVTLKEYVMRMPEDQEGIYYAAAQTLEMAKALPQVQAVKDKGYEVIFLTDNIDEFAIQAMMNFEEKEFINIMAADFDISTEEEKEDLKKANEEAKDVLDIMKNALGDKVVDIRFTNKLGDQPVCFTTEGDITIEMEKTINMVPNGERVHAELILEINANHKMADRLKECAGDEAKVADYATILYNMARMISGLPVEEPASLTKLICDLL